ncbi:DUF4362 domain-containing protein [Rossellomorea arthrocnemi]|jgi:hypothetical protein|uniref:DUF4362 domain-containing protein n=1 Tax=Rossellomorea arthrocnemi TaxID=2769542 RepID=UPI001918F587|nr:DUF4362 domain-containing protein [Rossellomorea arthrocnemi]
MTRKKGFLPSMIFGTVILATISIAAWLLLGGKGIKDKIKDGLTDDETSLITAMEDIEEVENKHGNIRNLDGLNTFINNMKNEVKSNLDVISYGIEGQKVTETITFNGENVNVYRSVDGEFIEEFQCKDLVKEESLQGKEYVLKQCTGHFMGETVLLSAPIEE